MHVIKCWCGQLISIHTVKTAKEFMSNVLANLFTQMFCIGYIPDRMKSGTIITLHKGGKKRTDDPNNYRAITLTSVVLKLFENRNS